MGTVRWRTAPLVLSICVLAVSACSASSTNKPPSTALLTSAASTHTSSAASTHTTSAASTPGKRSRPDPVDPLTGGKPSANPVVAVKIEDTAAGRPQIGIDKADIVYVEQVEGGLTRLLAIFHTRLPYVEPVRSTRANDPELALQFGPIAYVASGGSPSELRPLDASRLLADINDRGGPGFSRDRSRPVPNNLRANLAHIAAKLHPPRAKNIGLVWSISPSAPGTPATTVRTRVGTTPILFRWTTPLHRYLRIIDGTVQRTADGEAITTPNVIVQFCKSTVYTRDRDVLGNPAQYTHTTGTGKAAVFRNGRRINGTWTRKAVNDGTTLRDVHHKLITLAPGGAWFILTANPKI